MLKLLQSIIDGILAVFLYIFKAIGLILAFIVLYWVPIVLIVAAIAFLVFVPVVGIPVAIFCVLFCISIILSSIRSSRYQNKKKKTVFRILKDRPELLNDKETCINVLYSEVGDMRPEDLRDKDEEKNKDISRKVISDMIDEYIKKNK